MDAYPRLVSERLTLMPHTIADLDDLASMWSDASVTRLLGGPGDREASWQRLLRYAGSWALLGYGFWAVRETATGSFVGEVGFLDGKRTGVDGFNGDPEIGWCLNARHHGKGYATEAVRAALAWGDHRFSRCVAMIDTANEASNRVAERCGFARFADATYKDASTVLWQRFRP